MYKESQKNKILTYLKSGSGLTQLEAYTKFRCTRLSARIWDLRAEGYPIVGVNTNVALPGEDADYVTEYFLKTEEYAG